MDPENNWLDPLLYAVPGCLLLIGGIIAAGNHDGMLSLIWLAVFAVYAFTNLGITLEPKDDE